MTELCSEEGKGYLRYKSSMANTLDGKGVLLAAAA